MRANYRTVNSCWLVVYRPTGEAVVVAVVQQGVVGGGQHLARERAQLGEDVPGFVRSSDTDGAHARTGGRTDGTDGAGGAGGAFGRYEPTDKQKERKAGRT